MATGLELIISSICNATFCESVYDNPLTEILTRKQQKLHTQYTALNGKHLKVATYNNYPLSYVEKQQDGTLAGRGVAFIILDILQERFNFTFEVVVPNKNFEIGGSKPEDSIIGMVNSSMVDMAAAFVPTLVEFRRQVTFSNFLDEGVWSMMLKRPKESATGSGLLAPFEYEVWYCLLAALLCYVPIMSLITRLRYQYMQDGELHIPMSPSFWFVYAALIKQGTTLAPKANTNRIMLATWWLFIILVSSFYTANLTAFLTLSKFTLDIKSAMDLYRRNYRWVTTEGGAIEFIIKDPEEELNFLRQMVQNGRGEFRSFERDQDFLPLILGGAVLVKEQTSIEHLMYADYLSKAREGVAEADRCIYVVSPDAFAKIPRAFAFPMNTTLKNMFDGTITDILQAGIVNFLQNRDLPTTRMCPLDLQSKDRKLLNTDLMMTYMITVAGLITSIVVFVGEMLLRRYVRIKIRKGAHRKKNKRLKFKERDDGRPPPYDSLFSLNSRYKNPTDRRPKIVNGREYYEVCAPNGDTRLIPVRTPSAFLYQ